MSSIPESDSVIYTLIFFLRFFSIIGYYKLLYIVFPVPYSRSLLLTYFIYGSVYMLIPDLHLWSVSNCKCDRDLCVCPLSRVQLLCRPRDCSPPGSPVHGILQARTLEWVTISSSRASSRSMGQTWQVDSLPPCHRAPRTPVALQRSSSLAWC